MRVSNFGTDVKLKMDDEVISILVSVAKIREVFHKRDSKRPVLVRQRDTFEKVVSMAPDE